MFDTLKHSFQIYPYEEKIALHTHLCAEVHRTVFCQPLSCAHIGTHKMAEYCVLNNVVHTLEVKNKDLRCCQGSYGSELVLKKNQNQTLKAKVVLEGNCNSPQELQIVVAMSKTLKRDVYKHDFPFCFLPTCLIRILF